MGAHTRPYRVWMVACLKGGVGKTKTAMFTARELANRGHKVLVADADPGTQGVADWATRCQIEGDDLGFPVTCWDGRALLPGFIDEEARDIGADVVVLDLGAERPDDVRRAAMMADQIIVPIGPYPEEGARVEPTWHTISQTMKRGAGAILLTRVDQPGKGKAVAYREAFAGAGYVVLRTEIRRSAEWYDRFGRPIEDTREYAGVVTELLERESDAR